ncbi:MAG: DinB family protein [Flavobacteriales bacterium]
MEKELELRERLVAHIEGGEAFLNLEHALERVPFEQLGIRPAGFPYSLYELFYHIYLAQRDLLEYAKDSHYPSPQWPEGYWPDRTAPSSEQEWEALRNAYFEDRRSFQDILREPGTDLFGSFENGSGHTLFRQALLVIEHAAYHTGQIWLIMRKLDLHS